MSGVDDVQVFVLGPPRSGTTIVAQAINSHPNLLIYDEVNLLDVLNQGAAVGGVGRAFLEGRGHYETFCSAERATGSASEALNEVMKVQIAPRAIWGEKNPAYATRLDELKRHLPQALLIFVLRDPRSVVQSCLRHRRSAHRREVDFWIKDSVSEAFDLVHESMSPVLREFDGLRVLRYEEFVVAPASTLNSVFPHDWPKFSDGAIRSIADLPEGVGEDQFYRDGLPLPWKLGNMSPVRALWPREQRCDPDDPAWARVEALAVQLGYPDA